MISPVFFAPAVCVFAAFFLLPVARLLPESLNNSDGWGIYAKVITHPRYYRSLVHTFALSLSVTLGALALGGNAALYLERNRFPGRNLLVGMLTLPLSFPGVVVGFMIIMLAGRQGILGQATEFLFDFRLVFAYSSTGLLAGYLYFSIPRVVTTIMAAAGKLDKSQEEAARTLGCSSFQAMRKVTLPALLPALASCGAICFATSIGAFGTAFTLAADIDVLPALIYTEFTLSANLPTAAMLSLVLGAITWLSLFLARLVAGVEPSGGGA
jgi:putative spermidine/putrescine transport system permease protein